MHDSPSITILQTMVSKRKKGRQKKEEKYLPQRQARERAEGKLGILMVGKCALWERVLYIA